MLSQQGFVVVYAHPAQLGLEMTQGALHGAQPANAECPQCHGDGHVPQAKARLKSCREPETSN
jgi:hypothetical protein